MLTEDEIVEIGARALVSREGSAWEELTEKGRTYFCNDMRAALAAFHTAGLVLEQGWRFDMENAPRDGTLVDLWCVPPDDSDFEPMDGGIRLTDCAWKEGNDFFPHTGWIRVTDDGDYDLIDGPPMSPLGLPRWVPTAWRPLPAPPTDSKGGA